MALVVTGTVVTMDEERRIVRGGAVYLHGDTIEAVRPASGTPPAGYRGAPRLSTGGFVFPGLIDLHSHLAYNFLPLWQAPRSTPYTTRYQWPGAATYGRDISNPAQAMGIAAAAATLRYAEVKAAVGGVTSIQGSPPLTRAFPGWMVRNIEKEEFAGAIRDPVKQSVLPATAEQLQKYALDMKDGRSFVYHLAEGTDRKLAAEFEALDAAGCVQPGLVGIHSTALSGDELARWGSVGGAVVWSPFSNLLLYGDTTDVVEARRRGLRVCLGSDWAPSGTKNVMGELKVADLWSRTELGGALDARALCEMVTCEPGDTLARSWGRQAGRLQEGALADLAVVARRDGADDAYAALVRATERQVRLVVVGGRPVFGNRSLLTDAGADDVETIRVAGVTRGIRTRLPAELLPDDPALAAQANMSWADTMSALEAVRADPAGEVRRARERGARGAPMLQFTPDMPGPGGVDEQARALTDDELDSLVIAPIETLAHDRDWFARLRAIAPPHAALLLRLAEYYRTGSR